MQDRTSPPVKADDNVTTRRFQRTDAALHGASARLREQRAAEERRRRQRERAIATWLRSLVRDA